MTKELPGLEVPGIIRSDADVNSWVKSIHHKDIYDLKTTDVLIGVVYTRTGMNAVEIDLTKKQTNTIFLVGDEYSGKGDFMAGLLRRASDNIAEGHLNLDLITTHDDPNEFTTSLFLQKHLQNSRYTRVPESNKAARIITRVAEEIDTTSRFRFDKQKTHILMIEDLGSLVRSLEGREGAMDNLKKILKYKGVTPLLTVVGINKTDVKPLIMHGINKKFMPGVWMYGDNGVFQVWKPKKKDLSEINIRPFTT